MDLNTDNARQSIANRRITKLEDECSTRNNGKIAFSPRGRAIADKRSATIHGRIDRVLGKFGPFTEEFKRAIKDDHDDILERVHLKKELEGYKKVLNALANAPNDTNCVELLHRLNENPVRREIDCVLCPIWRHEYAGHCSALALLRYVFPETRSELYLATIIFDYSDNLHDLEDKYDRARTKLKEIVARISRKRLGIMMFGAFEPDIRSIDEIGTKRDLSKIVRDLGGAPSDAGGWVLTGHFIVRAPSISDARQRTGKSGHLKSEVELVFDHMLPAKGWDRVRFKRIYRTSSLADNLMQILGYASKYPAPLFKHTTRGKGKKKADKWAIAMEAAFVGPALGGRTGKKGVFDIDAAIRQWALFMDRIGPDKIYYSVENVHAQKWYSQSEMQYVRSTDMDMTLDGRNRTEIHRDTGPFSKSDIQPHLKGKIKRLTSRPIMLDKRWIWLTDISDVDPSTTAVSFDRVILK